MDKRRRMVPIAIYALLACIRAHSQTLIDVNEPRPLWRAIDVLEQVTNVGVNYEDPPYENMADLQDVSTLQERLANPGFQQIVPRDGHLTLDLTTAGNTRTLAGTADCLSRLLAIYRQNVLPGDFTIQQANGMLYVTPTKVADATGVLRDVTSPLLTPVTVQYANRSVAETAEAILAGVYHATGRTIVVGAFPYFPTDMVSFGANAEPARNALARLFAETAKSPLSYRLLFDPKPDRARGSDYMLNVQPVGYRAPMAPPGLGRIVAGSAANSTGRGSGARPGVSMVKQ